MKTSYSPPLVGAILVLALFPLRTAAQQTPIGFLAVDATAIKSAATNPLSLWQAGAAHLASLDQGKAAQLAAFNSVDPELLHKALTLPTQPADPAYVSVNKFIISVGYAQATKAATAAGIAPVVWNNATGQDAAAAGVSAVLPAPPLATDAWLRNNGVSFATGIGFIHNDEQDATLGSVLVRFNFCQRKATAKWNQRVGTQNIEGYAQVPYWGIVEYYNREKSDDPYQITRAPLKSAPSLPEFTFLGLFFGSGVLGEKIMTQGDEERPFLAGVSAGIGFYKEAAPFITLDVGSTISPKHAFKDSSLYVGISLDALVLTEIFGRVRKPVSGTDK